MMYKILGFCLSFACRSIVVSDQCNAQILLCFQNVQSSFIVLAQNTIYVTNMK